MTIWCMCETNLRPDRDFSQREEEQAAWYKPHSNTFKCCISKNKSQAVCGREDTGTEGINPPWNNVKLSLFKTFLKSIIYRASKEQG